MGTGSSVNNTLKLKLQGYTLGANTAISASDRLIEALGKIQGQISAFSGGSGFIPLSGTTALSGSIVPNVGEVYNLGSSSTRMGSIFAVNFTGNNLRAYSSSGISFVSNAGTTYGTIFGATGNWFLGTSPVDAGYKLDVNGTARIQATLEVRNNGGITVEGTLASSATAYTTAINDVLGTTLRLSPKTITNSAASASSTLAHYSVNGFGIPTLAASNTSVTYTNASNLYIAGPPVAGTNVSITNSYALWINTGTSYFGGSAFILGSIQSNGVNSHLGVGGADASAILTLNSTTKGLKIPSMTTVQKNAISSPATGLMVIDTNLNKLCIYFGGWQVVTSV